MSEQQEIVTPTESASNVGKAKKLRPGKAQRAAKSTVSQSSAQTAPLSMSNQHQFARKNSFAPIPQPGKYPVVFPSGAGEPTREAFIALDGDILSNAFSNLGPNYAESDKYAEFSSHAGYDDDAFSRDMTISALLSLSQQIVHAHANLGYSVGDFSSIASTDVYTTSAVRAIVTQFGEFSVESLGTKYLFKDYSSEVTALVRTAKLISKSDVEVEDRMTAFERHWLPIKSHDQRTSFILACKITGYFQKLGVKFDIEDLSVALFKEKPPWFLAAESLLPEAFPSTMFDGLFEKYDDKQSFVKKFSGENSALLDNLGLKWEEPHSKHLFWNSSPKVDFPELAEGWARRRATFTKFFSCGSGLMERSNAVGTSAQLAEVEVVNGITVIHARIAVTAPEFSLLACAPCTAFCSDVDAKRVVLTTALALKVRTIEFMQLDWKG